MRQMKRERNEVDHRRRNCWAWKVIERCWDWEGLRRKMTLKWDLKARVKVEKFESWVWSC